MWATDRGSAGAGQALLKSAIAALLLMTAGHAHAEPTVSDADIERARQSQPVITEQDMARARRRHPMPSETQLHRIPVPSAPNVDALPRPLSQRPIDLGALAKVYEANTDRMAQAQGLASGPGLLVFISFSMPEATLTRLVDQASRARAALVLRGFVNGSLRDTVARIQHLIGKRDVAVQIDPRAFERFAIRQTPSFVLVRAGAQPSQCAAGMCFAADAYALVAGDVSLDYALEYFQRATPRFARDAGGFLKRIRG